MANVAPAELRAQLEAFVRYRREHLTGDEKGEAQVYCERLFRAFGHEGLPEAGATLETCLTKNDAKGHRSLTWGGGAWVKLSVVFLRKPDLPWPAQLPYRTPSTPPLRFPVICCSGCGRRAGSGMAW